MTFCNMVQKNAKNASQKSIRMGILPSRRSNMNERTSLLHSNISTSLNVASVGLFEKKKLVKTYSKNQPVQVAKKYHFLTPDTPETRDLTQHSQRLSNSKTVNAEEILKPQSPQGVKTTRMLRNRPRPNSNTGSCNLFPFAIREPRLLDVHGSDSSSSSTLIDDTLNKTKKPTEFNTGAAKDIQGKKSSMSSDTSELSLELPRHADKEISRSFSKNSVLMPKKQKANRTSYTVKSISNCSARIPQASNRSLATVKSMTLCTSLVQPYTVTPLLSGEDNIDSLDEEDPKNSTWNETSLKPLFQDFLPEFLISPIKGVAEKQKKKPRISQRTKTNNNHQSSPYNKISQKRTTNQRCCAVKVDGGKAKKSSSSCKGRRRSTRITKQAKSQNLKSPVLTEKSAQREDSSLVDPLTSTRVYPEKRPLFQPDISAVETTVAQAQGGRKSHAREYGTEELLCYDPLPLQTSTTSVGCLAEQIREEDVTPETEEQKLRCLTVPRSVRRLELNQSKAPDCVVESFALGVRKKAKLAVCRVQPCQTRQNVLKNTTESTVMDSLIQI